MKKTPNLAPMSSDLIEDYFGRRTMVGSTLANLIKSTSARSKDSADSQKKSEQLIESIDSNHD